MAESGHKVDFTLPAAIKDFVFDLHDAVTRSRRAEDVQNLYEIKFKEVTEKFFHNNPWPSAEDIADEVGNDELFLLFYRELTFRHVTTKLKPQLKDHIASWTNYVKLFEAIQKSTPADLFITTQWIYDITQEFAYQFQGFCQYRCQVANHSPETVRVLDANREAWNLSTVMSILQRLIKAGKLQQQQKGSSAALILNSPSFAAQFGYFASIELARLECLMGDFAASLQAISSIKLNDRSELFVQLPLCHFNVYYHTGMCLMLLRRFSAALDVFSEICLHVSRISKPGAATPGLRAGPQQLQRMLDKVLQLTAVARTLCPGNRLDDQVSEMLDSKLPEKIRRLQVGDKSVYAELLEFASPKFISPVVPDYSVAVNINLDAATHIQSVFLKEIEHHLNFLKLRSFLGLYATIDIAKLARFNDVPESDLICQLVSFKHKAMLPASCVSGIAGAMATSSSSAGQQRVNTSDVHYYVDAGALVISTASTKAAQSQVSERYFIASVRKHADILKQVGAACKTAGLE